MRYNLKTGNVTYEGVSYIVMKNNRTAIGLFNLSTFLDKFTMEDIGGFKDTGGEIKMMNGKNIIVFNSKEDAQKGIEYLRSLMVLERLKE